MIFFVCAHFKVFSMFVQNIKLFVKKKKKLFSMLELIYLFIY